MEMSLIDSITQGQFLKLADSAAIRFFAKDFKLELQYLQSGTPTVEAEQTKPKGNLDGSGQTPSQLLFGKEFAEVNRTLVSMLGLKWLLANDYKAFAGCQSSENKLSTESFGKLSKYFRERLPNPDDVYVLLVSMAVGDIGKNADLAAKVEKATGCAASNHDEVVFLAAKEGMWPPLKKLSAKNQEDIILSLELGWKLNIGQLAQAENVPGSLNSIVKLKDKLKDDKRAYNIKILNTLLDVAGAGGHEDARCCARMSEPVFQGRMVTIEALNDFVLGSVLSQRECYDRILEAKAKILAQKEFVLLTVSKDEDRALLRLIAMGRASSNKKHAVFIKQAFEQLPEPTRRRLVKGLNVDGVSNDIAIIPYNAPALFAVVFRNTQDGKDVSLTSALMALMRLLTRVLNDTKIQAGETGTVVERDLSFVQDVIKSQSFYANPNILDEIALPWQ
ncbi:hypothetical protein F5884DRAFT_507195 [Xylogone sp. PMI_703]|nr:hypothetical protein F5884DRAFT_507195 [Xylogone sp. PMI_703]